MAYNVKAKRTYFKLSGARRRDCVETIEIPAFEKGNEFHTWISFISDDRQRIANSSYVASLINW